VAAALSELPGEIREALWAAWRERDELSRLRTTLDEAERADGLEARLRALATGAHLLGFPTAAVVLVSATGAAEFVIGAEGTGDLADRLVAQARPTTWEAPFDDSVAAVSILLAVQGSRPTARFLLARPAEGFPAALVPTIQVLAAQALRAITDARTVEIAERRAARLQRLQEVGTLLARTLDESEVHRELVRQILRVIPCRGVVVAHPDLERGQLRIGIHWEAGEERVRPTAPLGSGVLADVARSGRTVRIATVGPDTASLEALQDLVGGSAAGVGSVLAVPMLVGTQLIGVIGVYATSRKAFNAEDEEVLGTIAAQAASATVNARLYEESQRERRQSEALSEIARAVGESLKMHEVLRLIQRHAIALLRAKGATVMLRKEDFLHVVAASGYGEVLSGMFLPLEGSMSGRAVLTGQYVLSNDSPSEVDVYLPMQQLASIKRTIIAPLVTAQGAIGALAVFDRDHEFTEDDARILQRLADHVAVAIVNARLYEDVASVTRELAITFDSIAAGLVVVDEAGVIRRTNARAVDLLDAPGEAALHGALFPERLLGITSVDDFWPLQRAVAESSVQRATLTHPARGVIYEVVVSPHPEGGAVIFFDDVTLFHSLADRHRDLLENAYDAIYTLDRDGVVTSANAATEALLGATRDALIGRTVAAWLDPDELAAVTEEFQAASEGLARHYECQIVRADGARRLLSVSNTPIRVGETITGVMGIARDVTEERAAASALERADARYTRLVESAADAIFTVDEEGRFTAVNAALERGLGRDRLTLVGEHFTSVVIPDDRPAMWEAFITTLAGERVRRDLRYVDADGIESTGVVTTAPIIEAGRVTGALGIMRDVTEERLLMAQVIRQERLVALGQLVGGVAHELNNPLAGISAHAQLLSEAMVAGADAREAAKVIAAEASRAGRIVGKLLSFVRQNDSDRLPVDLNSVVRDTIELRAYVLRVQEITLVTDFAEALPPVMGDPAPLQQVLVNLLANAEHAVMGGSRERRIVVSTETDGNAVRVLIRDSGMGIPAEHLDRIFNPFFTTKPRGLGTGLGLSISDGIVREHGGRLMARSTPGEGSTFIVELPVWTGIDR
jgi:PAS domain S-box-containing protein